jgi:sugar lactone lactonase YvrE
VEVGPDGMLYVSSLPGGPEDGSLGLKGGVFRVDPSTGEATRIVGGLLSATGIAVTDTGDILVAQLFGGSIVRIAAGTSTAEVWREAKMPADVEWTPEATYATTRALSDPPKGRLQRWANEPVS